MEIQNWIFAQLVIDVILGICLLLFIRYYIKAKKAGIKTGEAFQGTEIIISEMQELTRQLDRNLEEKKELSRKILNQLDEGLKKAEESYNQLQGLIREMGTAGTSQDAARDRGKIWSTVSSLLAKGLSKEEIAQHTGISVSEIELLLKLHQRTGKIT